MQDKMKAKVCRHTKTGKLYAALAVAVNCTNANDGQRLMVYAPMTGGPSLYVREVDEFYAKFQESKDVSTNITLTGQWLNYKYPLFDLLPGLLALVEALCGPMIPELVQKDIAEDIKNEGVNGETIVNLNELSGFVGKMMDAGLFRHMIVKIQRPLASNVENPGCLVYNQSRTLMQEFSMDTGIMGLFEKDDLKIYAYARFWADGTLQIVARVEDQPW